MKILVVDKIVNRVKILVSSGLNAKSTNDSIRLRAFAFKVMWVDTVHPLI